MLPASLQATLCDSVSPGLERPINYPKKIGAVEMKRGAQFDILERELKVEENILENRFRQEVAYISNWPD